MYGFFVLVIKYGEEMEGLEMEMTEWVTEGFEIVGSMEMEE